MLGWEGLCAQVESGSTVMEADAKGNRWLKRQQSVGPFTPRHGPLISRAQLG